MSCLFCNLLIGDITSTTNLHPLKELNCNHNNISRLPDIFYEDIGEAPPTPTTPPVNVNTGAVFQIKPARIYTAKISPAKSQKAVLRRVDYSYNLIAQFPHLTVVKRLARVGVQALDLRFNIFTHLPDFGDTFGEGGSSAGGTISGTLRYSHILLGIENTIPSRIADNLYLGGAECARNTPLLKHLNIRYILNAAFIQNDAHFPDLFEEVKVLNANDDNSQDMACFFSDCNVFIDKAREVGGVLVHCIAGKSRSVTIVIAYLMYKEGLSFKDAFAKVKAVRDQSQPNFNFQIQLHEYEQTLKQIKEATNGLE